MLNCFFFNFLLFCIGLFGIIFNKQNLIKILLSIELILLSINLNFLFFSLILDDMFGELFALFILIIAAAESSIGLAIIIVFFRIRGSISINEIHTLSL